MKRKRQGAPVSILVILLGVAGMSSWILGRAFLRARATHALAIAVYHNDTDAALSALRAGGDPNTRQSPKDMPPTFLQVVQQFLRQMRGGKTPSAADADHRPPMIALAAAKGNTEVVQALLHSGASPNAYARYGEDEYSPDDADATEGQTALMWAAKNEDMDMTKALLDSGANPNFNDSRWGEAPLLQTTDPAVMEILLAHGADVHIGLKHSKFAGITPLRYVILNLIDNEEAIQASHLNGYRCMEVLLAHGADINEDHGSYSDEEDRGYESTPLQMVARYGTPDDVRFVLAKGGGRYHGKVTDWDALASAIDDGRTDNMQVLLRHGFNANRRDTDGRTPLFQAVEHGVDGPVQALIDAGAKVNIRDKNGVTPLHLAIRDDNGTVQDILEKAGARR